jgi:Na+/melibiose symporter-like transporter
MSSPGSRSLWRHRDFLLLWSGQTVSEIGSAVTLLALPLAAVGILGASTLQVGLLTSAGTVAYLIVTLPAGVVVDRVRKNRLMQFCNVGRAVSLGSVPVAASLGHLTMAQLYAAAAATSVLTVFFDVAYQSYLPTLLEKNQLTEGNAKLGSTQSLASVAGPGLGGALVTAVGAAMAVVVDSLSFVFSAITLALIRTQERREQTGLMRTGRTVRHEIVVGIAFIFGDRILRMLVACTATANLFLWMLTSLQVVFLARVLHASPTTIGVVLALASAGGLLGAAVARPAARLLGSARAIWVPLLAFGWTIMLVPLAQPGWGVLLVAVGVFGDAACAAVYNVGQISYRQAVCPPELLGRMTAGVRWIVWGMVPVGGLLGGVLGTALGVRETLWIAAAGTWLSVLWVVGSPLRRMRDVPVLQEASQLEPAAG